MSVSITFQDPDYDEIIELGEFFYTQLTYNHLYGCQDEDDEEEDIASYDNQLDTWYFTKNYSNKHGYRKGPWSDIIFG